MIAQIGERVINGVQFRYHLSSLFKLRAKYTKTCFLIINEQNMRMLH